MIPLDDITRARETIAGVALRTPLVRLRLADAPGRDLPQARVPAADRLVQDPRRAQRHGRGAAGRAGAGRRDGERGQHGPGRGLGARASAGCRAPSSCPTTRRRRSWTRSSGSAGASCRCRSRTGGDAIETSRHPRASRGYFVHPVLDDAVMAGNGTIGLEILEDLPDVDAVLVPWGGGGLTCGIASALKQQKPGVRVISCEPETGAPLAASLPAGESRVGRLPRLVRRRLGQPRAAPEDVGPCPGTGRRAPSPCPSTRRRRRCACSPSAPASSPRAPERSPSRPPAQATAARGKVVCIVSGGNIDSSRLVEDPGRRDPRLT